MELKYIYLKSKEFAHSEARRIGAPEIEFINIATNKGIELAEKLGENKYIVGIGCNLMDIALGEALKEDRIKEHVAMSVEKATEFLANFDLDKEIVNRILLCVSSHHSKNGFGSKEAEICANADCYKFLVPLGIFRYFMVNGERKLNYEEGLNQVLFKIEEKWEILSLDICKKELEPHYRYFKKEIENIKSNL